MKSINKHTLKIIQNNIILNMLMIKLFQQNKLYEGMYVKFIKLNKIKLILKLQYKQLF